VRITAHRSANALPGAALEKSAQRAGDSFFEALANASSNSTASSKLAPIAIPLIPTQANADPEQVEKQESDSSVFDRIPAQVSEPQILIAPADAKSATQPATSQAAGSRATTGATQGKTNQQPQWSSNVLAAKIAASVALPSLPPVDLVPAVVAASASQSAVQGDLAGEDRESNTGTSEIPAASAKNRSSNAAHGEATLDENSQSTAWKPADARTELDPRIESDTDLAAQHQNASDSKPEDSSAAVAIPQSLTLATSAIGNLALPQLDILPGAGGNADSGSKDVQTIKTPDAGGAKSPDLQGANGATKAPASASQTAASVSSTAGAGNANQTSQHAQAGASQPALAPARSADSGAMPAQSIPVQGAPREAAAHAQTDAPSGATRAAGQPLPQQSGDAATAAINNARLIQSMSQTEMRVGMHSAEFGEISIRTMVSQQQLTAQISVDHGDLASTISTHIPAMQEKLGGDTGLKALVEVSQGNMSFSGERGNSSPRQQPSHAAPVRIEDTNSSIETEYPVSRPTTTWAVGNAYRLDIRA
jgi:hypothetical protein